MGNDGVALGEGNDGDLAGESVDYGAGAADYMRGNADGGYCGSRKRKRGHQEVLLDFRPSPTDYLQAFSHFSYAYSDRKMLVCDLQGVKSHCSPDNPTCAGVFELTGEIFLPTICISLLTVFYYFVLQRGYKVPRRLFFLYI